MKKYLYSLFFLVLFSLLSSITLMAEMNDIDSLTINDSINQKIVELDPEIDLSGVQIIRVFNTSIHFAFENAKTIEDVLSSKEVLNTYYVATQDNKIIITATINDDDAMLLPDISISPDILDALSYDYLNVLFEKEVSTSAVYLLWGNPSMSGTAICYVKDIGEYVYYTHYDYKGKAYLFPATDFCEYQKSILNAKKEYAELDGGTDISTICDISKYDILQYKNTKTGASNIGNTDLEGNTLNKQQLSTTNDGSKKPTVQLVIALCVAILIIVSFVTILISKFYRRIGSK